MQINETVKAFIKEELLYNEDNVNLEDNQSLLEGGIIDSMGIMKIISFIEEKFKISVSDSELIPDNFQTVASISSFISNKLGQS
jgi:acyl carrier protein